MTTRPFVLTQYRHWSHRQTDGQTDRQTDIIGKTILRWARQADAR